MAEEEKYTLQEAHLKFAKKLNGETWDLLEKQDRSLEDEERMIHAAHASLYHWLQVGTAVNRQRGEYMLARAYAAADLGQEALRHARRCVQITIDHREKLEDFDVAFAYECLARAHACAGNADEALVFWQEAHKLGKAIADPQDKEIFERELYGGDWFGIR